MLPVQPELKLLLLFSTTKRNSSLAQLFLMANMAKKTFASVFPACSVATVSNVLLNSTSTTLKKLSSKRALKPFTKQTKLSLQLSNLR